MLWIANMDALIPRLCLSLLLLTSIATSAESNETNNEEPREPRVSGRIVKLYSGAKPEPYHCNGEGFQLDPNNCASFYRCIKEQSGKFTVFRYQCAPGTVYDPDLETCNHPRSTRRTECGGMLKPSPELHDASNINEIDGAQSELPRPISTKAPIYAEVTTLKNPTTLPWILSTKYQNPTNAPWKSTKNSSPSLLSTSTQLPHYTSNNQWLHSTQQQWESQYTSNGLPITTHLNSINTEPCTSDGFMGDSDNCRKFYRCVGNQRGGYIKYEFSCSQSTVWDDEIQGCNHPWAVKRSKCGRSMSSEDKYVSQKLESGTTEESTTKDLNVVNGQFGYKLNKTIQQQLQISYSPKVTQTQTQISNSHDIIQNQTQIIYGDRVLHNTNSKTEQNQTQISYGTAVSQTQTQFDYGSKGIQTQLQIDHSMDTSQSQLQVVDSTSTIHSTTVGSTKKYGNTECSESGFVGDADDCKKFYRCVNNGKGYTKYEYFCSDGTVWDPEIEACNHAWAVKRCGVINPPIISTTETYIVTTEKATVSHTENSKITTIYATNHVSSINDADDVGYDNQNNHETSPTTTPKTSTTKPTTQVSSELSSECSNSGFMGDANDCRVFYRCVDNGNSGFIKYEFKCGDGTVWDPDIEACNHAWAVKKCGGTTSSNAIKEETTTSSKENTSVSENVHTTVTLVQISTQAPDKEDSHDIAYGLSDNKPSKTTTSMSPILPPKQDTSETNICQTSGFMGDKNDCKKFYRCVDNGNGGYIKYEFTCGQGTVWNPKIDACDHEWAVENCRRSNNFSESSSYETTSLSSFITSSGDSSSIPSTQVSKVTDTPMATANTTSSTTTISIGNKCSNSGFMGDNSDCKKFYRCVDNEDGTFTRFEFTCGEGTVWDPKIEACNHAWAVDECGGNKNNVLKNETQQTTSQKPVIQNEEQESGYVTPNYEISEVSPNTVPTISSVTTPQTFNVTNHCTNSGFMGDKNDCKKFYRCVDNGKGGFDRYEFQCGEGTVWDENIEACNHAWAVKNCGGNETSTTAENVNQSSSSPNIIYNDGSTSTEKSTTSTAAHKEPGQDMSNECVEEGFYGDKRDCRKFYRCVDNGKEGFTKYVFECGKDTAWNQEIQGCEHMSSDKSCSSSTSQVGTTQQPSHLNDDMNDESISSNKTTTVTAQTESQSTNNTQSSANLCNSEGFYADPSDCKHFYRCVANSNSGYTKYDFKCGDGTIWNQNKQICDHEPSDKSCSSSSSMTHTTESQLESTTSSSWTTKAQEITNKTESSENTDIQCTSEGFFAHSNDCKKFIRCVENGNGRYTRYEFSCGDGTVWVQEIQACDHDNDINNCTSHIGTTTQTTNIYSSSSSPSVVSNTESILSNDEYDSQTSNEQFHDESDDCTSEGYFGNKKDCRKFYRCVNDGEGGYIRYDFVCGEGTAWDSDLQTCNHINEVKSCSDVTSQENENLQTTTNKNQTGLESTTSSTTIPSTTKTTTSSGSSSSSQNTCENEGYFGDTKNCKKFYRCVDNGKGGFTKYDFSCGEGTIWDQDITACNHPQDVSNPSCNSTQETSDSSSTTISTTSSQTTSSTTESTNNSQNTSDCSQESSKKPANDNVTCNKAGYYANPNDCKKFYRCVDWDGDGKRFSVFHFECGEGTIWDPALDTCNHEDSVYPKRDCSQTQTQNVGSETTTTGGSTTTTTASGVQATQKTTTEQSNESTTVQQTTTQESTTSEQTTTRQPTTSEKTTTQESTTSEQTTTQEPTTSEITPTQESTTSEQTTTQESTTSIKTTTQESTTSEQTTNQEPTTSEIAPTQESTTSEQSTTQESTTSEKTTQESTTSEQTTTHEPTTSEKTTQESTTTEQTTTQQYTTTSEQTTTQQPTTSEQSTTEETTTQQSTTGEQTTAEQSTTSEQTTTPQPTSEHTTTQQSSESTSTTQDSSSTEQTTLDQSTTSEQTTTEQYTDQTSTQASTTSEQTTTQESTISQHTTTQQYTTSEQTTTEQSSESTTEQSSSTTEQATDGTTTTDNITDGTLTTDYPTDGTTIEEVTEQSTTQTSSTESDSTEDPSSTTEESSFDKECPETEGDQYLLVCPTSFKRHPKYCNMFYQCTEEDDTYESKVAMFKCPNNTIYDESKTQCVTEDKAEKKCNGEIANKRRFKRLDSNYREMIVADNEQHSCSGIGYFSFEKQSECSKGFLKCEKSKNGKLRGYVYQCPDGYVYWTISKRCERMESVRDCKRSSNDWTGRWNIPVERKNVAIS